MPKKNICEAALDEEGKQDQLARLSSSNPAPSCKPTYNMSTLRQQHHDFLATTCMFLMITQRLAPCDDTHKMHTYTHTVTFDTKYTNRALIVRPAHTVQDVCKA